MNFTDLLGELTSYQAIKLAEILQEFIAIEKLLDQHSDKPDREKFLREARICSARLKSPPWNISIATLSEICDNTTHWAQDIDQWIERCKL